MEYLFAGVLYLFVIVLLFLSTWVLTRQEPGGTLVSWLALPVAAWIGLQALKLLA